MKDSFKKRLFIGAGIIGGSVIVTLIVFYFVSGDLSANADQVVSERTAIENQDDAVSNFATLKTDLPQAEEYQAMMGQLLPDQYGLVTFNSWVGKIGKKYSVVAVAATQGNATAPQGATPGKINFEMDASGPEGSMVPFLQDVASTSPGFLFSFSAINFTNSGSQESIVVKGTLFFK